MKTQIWADGDQLFANAFVSHLVGHVAQGIVASLKMEDPEIRTIEFRLQEPDKEAVSLEVNGRPVSLQLTSGFTHRIIASTLRGLLQPLKGTAGAKEVVIRVEAGEP